MTRLVTALAGAIAEAWQEFRVHRGRVLLALVGVAVAITALTSAIAVSEVAQQTMAEEQESYSGRIATLSIYPSFGGIDAASVDATDEAWSGLLDRFDIEYASRITWASTQVRFRTGTEEVQLEVVDHDFAAMHRVRLVEGAWFGGDDPERLVPLLVVNEAFWDRIDRVDLRTHPVVTLPRLGGAQAVVIGVYDGPDWNDFPTARILTSQYRPLVPGQTDASPPEYRMWVPAESAAALEDALDTTMAAMLGVPRDTVEVQRTDYGAWGGDDPFAEFRMVTVAVSMVILLLGALGLLNISLVSVKQRIREIGIRRSFGATSRRVFFAVMMESVVATAAAGMIGVMLSILLVRSPLLSRWLTGGQIQDLPPFPAEAAVIGLIAATVVGALAGIIPALIAVRVKVIDAIRF